jgi:hypothetical protein
MPGSRGATGAAAPPSLVVEPLFGLPVPSRETFGVASATVATASKPESITGTGGSAPGPGAAASTGTCLKAAMTPGHQRDNDERRGRSVSDGRERHWHATERCSMRAGFCWSASRSRRRPIRDTNVRFLGVWTVCQRLFFGA